MSSLAPITLGMVGLGFALWANGVQLLGVDAKPATEDGPGPTASVAGAGSAMGAITLLCMSIWLVVAAPLGTDGEAVKLGLLFSAISGMYGLLWLGAAVVQARGWDTRRSAISRCSALGCRSSRWVCSPATGPPPASRPRTAA
jgi:hypothetical protein